MNCVILSNHTCNHVILSLGLVTCIKGTKSTGIIINGLHEVMCFNECSKNGSCGYCFSLLFLKQHKKACLQMLRSIFILLFADAPQYLHFTYLLKDWMQSCSKQNGFSLGLLNVDTIRIIWALLKCLLPKPRLQIF